MYGHDVLAWRSTARRWGATIQDRQGRPDQSQADHQGDEGAQEPARMLAGPLSNPRDNQLLSADATISTKPMMTRGPMLAVKPFQPYPMASVAEKGARWAGDTGG